MRGRWHRHLAQSGRRSDGWCGPRRRRITRVQGERSMDRRRFLTSALAAPMVGAFASSARAQAWQPSRNITMIVAFPPGGQADLAARPVALALEKILGKSVVVDNRAGAGG